MNPFFSFYEITEVTTIPFVESLVWRGMSVIWSITNTKKITQEKMIFVFCFLFLFFYVWTISMVT